MESSTLRSGLGGWAALARSGERKGHLLKASGRFSSGASVSCLGGLCLTPVGGSDLPSDPPNTPGDDSIPKVQRAAGSRPAEQLVDSWGGYGVAFVLLGREREVFPKHFPGPRILLQNKTNETRDGVFPLQNECFRIANVGGAQAGQPGICRNRPPASTAGLRSEPPGRNPLCLLGPRAGGGEDTQVQPRARRAGGGKGPWLLPTPFLVLGCRSVSPILCLVSPILCPVSR